MATPLDRAATPVLLSEGGVVMRRFSPHSRRISKKRPRVRRQVRPAVEALEDRSLLSLFGAPIPFVVGPDVGMPMVADFNGDGRQDFAAVSDGAVNVLLNNGLGGFADPAHYTVAGASALAASDFEGNGRPSLLTSDSAGDVLLLPNNGDGTFGAPATVLVGNGFTPSLAVADFNHDGKPDLAVSVNGTVSVLFGHGDNTFAAPVNYDVPGSAFLAAGDFNGDGRPDLVVTTPSATPGYSVLLNNGAGTFTPVANPGPTISSSGKVAVGDFNGDGRADLAVPEALGGVAILLSRGDGTFALSVDLPVGAGLGRQDSLAVGDFNGDGKQDLAYGYFFLFGPGLQHTSSLQVLPGRGDGTFDTAGPTYLAQGIGSFGLAVGDFNGDGRPDLFVAAQPPGKIPYNSVNDTVSVLLNTRESAAVGPQGIGVFDPGSGTWYLRNAVGPGGPDAGQFPYGGAGWLPVVGDWDGNGTTTVGVVDPGSATWYLRNSNSPGGPDAATPFPYGLPGWVPVVGDWNGTGHTGIGMFDPATGTWYLRNEDGPGAPDAGVFPYGGAGWLPVVGDWTGSGRTTIGVVDPRTMTWYLRNSNSAGGADIAPFPYGGVGWQPVVGDWTGGGKTTVGVIDPSGVWYPRNSNSPGGPDFAPFPYGLGSWAPVAGGWAGAGAAGSPRAAAAQALPQPLDASSASLSAAPVIPAPEAAASPAATPSPPPSAAGDSAPAEGRRVLAGMSAQPSRPAAVRQALRAGQARTAALDELFAAGLE
jgi:hypothetical protein